MSVAFFNGAIPKVFGNGLLGNAVTGLIRIPAFMSNCIAVMMVGELAIRGLTNVIQLVGLSPDKDSWVQSTATNITKYGVRPYKDMELGELLVRTVAFAALGIVASEITRVLGGTAPGVYNSVLSFLGPIRIDTRPYLTCVREVLGWA